MSAGRLDLPGEQGIKTKVVLFPDVRRLYRLFLRLVIPDQLQQAFSHSLSHVRRKHGAQPFRRDEYRVHHPEFSELLFGKRYIDGLSIELCGYCPLGNVLRPEAILSAPVASFGFMIPSICEKGLDKNDAMI